MIINVIDLDDSTTRPAADSIGAWNDRVLTEQGNSTIIRLYGMSNGVAVMVQRIRQVAATQSIDILRIWGHGSPGNQNVSAESGGAIHWAGISVSNFEQIRGHLLQLRELFNPRGWAELRGCSVAEGNDGERLLQLLAATWNVPVYGGSVTQRTAHSDWVPPIYRSEPNGSMSRTTGVRIR